MRTRAHFLRRGSAADQYGNPHTEWSHYATRYGSFREAGAQDVVVGGATKVVVRARFTVRADPSMRDLPDTARVDASGRTWRVVGKWNRIGTAAGERNFIVLQLEALD